MESRRVSIVITDAGGGHRSVAEAIRCAVNECYPDVLQVEIVEFPGGSDDGKKGKIPALYEFSTRRFLPVYNLFWHLSDHQRVVNSLTSVVYASVRKKARDLLQRRDSDVLLAGNAFLGNLLHEARSDLGLDTPILVVVSDLASIHSSWSSPKVDLTIVPTDLAQRKLLEMGIPGEKVIQTEFPIHPRYLRIQRTMREARLLLGLDPERFTTLVTGGGAGSGLLEYYVRRLRSAFPEDQLLVVTGSNKGGFRRLKRQVDDERVRLFQRVGNMDDLICASDVVVTKAGPSTMMECLALDRKLIVTRGVGAQEAGNIEYMLRDARVHWQHTGDGLVKAIREIKQDGRQFAAEPAFRSNGAYQIAEILWHWATGVRDVSEKV